MPNRRLILAGGGSENDSLPLDKRFASWIGPTGRMLYLPIAMDGKDPSYEACLAWVKGVFASLDIGSIEMWTDIESAGLGELNDFDAIYIGGGNTFRLAHLVRATGFDLALFDFVAQGGPLYGGSAGAILLGRDIQTCAHLDANEVGLKNTTGLDLVDGYAIWCHYQPKDDTRIFRFVEERNIPVLALSERAGVSVEDDKVLALGFEGVRIFRANEKQYFEVGRSCV